jgi:hypothetical protein
MQLSGFGLPRIPLLGISVNKPEGKLRGFPYVGAL